MFDARPRDDDASPLDQLLRTFPAVLDRLAAVPDFLLWIETDRLLPPWDVQQDVFEAYLEDGDEEEPRPKEEDDDEEDEDFIEEIGEEETASENSALRIPSSAIPPFADPPTGPFDRGDRALIAAASRDRLSTRSSRQPGLGCRVYSLM